MGWKAWNGSLSFFSLAPRSSPVKPPWGPIVSCVYHTATNSREETGQYFKMSNEDKDEDPRNFKADLLSAMEGGINDFTQKAQDLVNENKSELLAKYLSLLTTVKGFNIHRPNLHSEDGFPTDKSKTEAVIEDLEKNGGSYDDFVEFSTLAKENAFLVIDDRDEAVDKMNEDKFEGSAPPENNKKKAKPSEDGPKPKLSKAEMVVNETKAELQDKNGVEKAFTDSYLGKADILLDNISLSPNICLPVSDWKVKGIMESMLTRFDPSLLRVVLFPADESIFNPRKLRDNSYHVVQGIHSILALKALDKVDKLKCLPGLQFKRIHAIIINTTNPALLNYGNLRGNDLSSKFVSKPRIQDLIYVLESLSKYYGKTPKALEVTTRYAKSFAFGAEDLTALKKLSQWSAGALSKLVETLQKYENYQTRDAKVKGNQGRLQRGEKMPMPKVLFYKLSKCLSDYIESNIDQVLEKKVSLKELVDNFAVHGEREKTFKSLTQISNFDNVKELTETYPDKFTPEVLDSYSGAEMRGSNKNTKFVLLEQYFKSVINDDAKKGDSASVEYEELDNISKFGEKLVDFDVAILDVKPTEMQYGEVLNFLDLALDLVMNVTKPCFSMLILFNSEQYQSRVLSYLRSKTLTEEKFEIHQIFFDADNRVSSGHHENLKFCVLFGKIELFEKPLKSYYGDQSNLVKVVKMISPPAARVGFYAQSKLPIVSVHTPDDLGSKSFVYFGSQVEIKKFQAKLDRKTIAANKVSEVELEDDAEAVNVISKQTISLSSGCIDSTKPSSTSNVKYSSPVKFDSVHVH